MLRLTVAFVYWIVSDQIENRKRGTTYFDCSVVCVALISIAPGGRYEPVARRFLFLFFNPLKKSKLICTVRTYYCVPHLDWQQR